ncbi:MAG TPA: GNAT family N-acetyltransferase [Reyranella sp.]|nr:GNAT family N-acetyltransferase [Reyranella sp.]
MSDRLPPTPTLASDRLALRPLRMEDAPVIQWRFPKWEIVRFLNGDSVPWPYPADGAAGHIATCLEAMARREKLHWSITLRGALDEPIGRIDLWPDDGKSRDMRGFWLDPEHHGKGFMTEAAERATEFAFVELGWPYLWLSNDERNVASRRIKEKQGAILMDREPCRSVEGPGMREVWRLDREAWLARRLL